MRRDEGRKAEYKTRHCHSARGNISIDGRQEIMLLLLGGTQQLTASSSA